MTAASHAVSLLDDGSRVSSADVTALEVFDAHSPAASWHTHAQRHDLSPAGFCVICGQHGDVPKCDNCFAGHDYNVERTRNL
ncbi:hypothetical protein [Actinoplanes sp. URMC 104]|uniref:hypothetical protein n=1 Tax=Actinoplanes sp. URMC 104 TaxID=3423409 RepID=UPI003F1B8C14